MKSQKGFTLIEIVMVLVLLGILSAVAVPKYYDLTAKAEENAAKAVAAEFQARVNAVFAKNLLDGKNCETSRTAAMDGDASITGWTLTWTAAGSGSDTGSLKVVKTGGSSTDGTTVTIAIPKCGS